MQKTILSIFIALAAVANVYAVIEPENPPVNVPDSSFTVILLGLGVVFAVVAKRFGRRL